MRATFQSCLGLINLSALNANNVLTAPAGAGGTPTILRSVRGGIRIFHSARHGNSCGTCRPCRRSHSGAESQLCRIRAALQRGAPGGNRHVPAERRTGRAASLSSEHGQYSSPNCQPLSGHSESAAHPMACRCSATYSRRTRSRIRITTACKFRSIGTTRTD